jgi:P-type Na+/K+ transporter
MDSLRSLSSPTAAVLRDGNLDHVPSITVVPGDIVELKTGDVVPADLRLFEAMNFETDEALLTGESLPVLKEPEIALDHEVGVGDRTNMAFSSSTVTKGRARGIVTGTGMATEIGAIAEALRGKTKKPSRSMSRKKHGNLQPVKGAALNTYDAIGKLLGLTVGTPLQRKLAKLAYCLLFCAVLLAIIVFAANKFHIPHEVAIYAISLGKFFLIYQYPAFTCLLSK